MASVDLAELMRWAAEKGVADIFIKADAPPCVKLHGKMVRVTQTPLTPEETKSMAALLMTEDQMVTFEHEKEMDLGFTLPGVCRFRVNIFQQRGTVSIVMRIIMFKIRTIEELGLPASIAELTRHRQGFVLVTGPTGSGKSTTLAAMLDLINREKAGHIVTMEDPIEYIHPDKSSIVNQREIHQDTMSFTNALRAVLREAPDVILVGELRDADTFDVCLKAAETGHLVFSTVHTQSAAETIRRILNMFPPEARMEVCLRLARSLKGIVAQTLVPRSDIPGRLVAPEILVVTPTVEQFIEEGKTGEIYGAIKEGALTWGMQTMNMGLGQYYREGKITQETALSYAGNRTEMKHMLRQVDADKEKEAQAAMAQTLAARQPGAARPGARPVGPPPPGAPMPPPQPPR